MNNYCKPAGDGLVPFYFACGHTGAVVFEDHYPNLRMARRARLDVQRITHLHTALAKGEVTFLIFETVAKVFMNTLGGISAGADQNHHRPCR